MWAHIDIAGLDPQARWHSLHESLAGLLSPADHPITVLANAAAFIYEATDRLNWAGFYLFDGSQLVLGPFCGKPACTSIRLGNGVCGTAAERGETVVVADVDAFPGHIACDGASRSEIVLPMIAADGRLIGVLDIDSPELDRFDENDRHGLEQLRDVIVERLANRAVLAT